MYQKEHYKLPNPWGFVETAKIVIEQGGENYIGFSWFGEKEDPIVGQTKAYCCIDCQKLIIDALKRINETFDKNVRTQILEELFEEAKKIDCKHYKEFQRELQYSRNNKRKTLQRRLHDYYESVINDKTGAQVTYEEGPEL